jgi:hypothetical protein
LGGQKDLSWQHQGRGEKVSPVAMKVICIPGKQMVSAIYLTHTPPINDQEGHASKEYIKITDDLEQDQTCGLISIAIVSKKLNTFRKRQQN